MDIEQYVLLHATRRNTHTSHRFRKAGYNAIDRICDYYYNLQSMPVKSSVSPGYLAQHVPTSPPEQGEPWQQILDDYTEHIIPGLTHWQHPSFYGYFPTACSFPSILAELLASSTPNPGFNVRHPSFWMIQILKYGIYSGHVVRHVQNLKHS